MSAAGSQGEAAAPAADLSAPGSMRRQAGCTAHGPAALCRHTWWASCAAEATRLLSLRILLPQHAPTSLTPNLTLTHTPSHVPLTHIHTPTLRHTLTCSHTCALTYPLSHTHTCLHVHTPTQTPAQTLTHTCSHILPHAHMPPILTRIFPHMHVHTPTLTYIRPLTHPTHTHTGSQSHTHTCSHTLPLIHTNPHTFICSHTHTSTHTHTHTPTSPHMAMLSYSHTLTQPHTLIHTPSFPNICPHIHTGSHPHTLTPMEALTHTPSHRAHSHAPPAHLFQLSFSPQSPVAVLARPPGCPRELRRPGGPEVWVKNVVFTQA